MKETFIVKTAWKSVFDDLSDKQAGVLIKAVFSYMATGEMPAGLNDGEIKMALRFMAIDLNTFSEKYESRCATNRENGSKGAEFGKLGGRPRKKEETPKNPEKPRTGLENPLNDNENDNDFSKKEKIQKEKNPAEPETGESPAAVNDRISPDTEDVLAPPAEAQEAPPEDFERFWNAYGKKRGRAETLRHWRGMTRKARDAALCGVAAYVAANPEPVYRKDPVRYLRHRCWEDENYVKPENRTQSHEPIREYLPGADRYF